MNQAEQHEQIGYPEDEINLLNLFLVLLKRRKMIIMVTLFAIVLSIAYSLLKPDIYTATARILPPQESDTGLPGSLSQTGGIFGGLAGSLMGGGSAADVYVGILQSRSVADRLVKKFNLKELYQQQFLDATREKLAARTNINISSETYLLTISVEDEDPQRAAHMANTYVDALDQINRTINITEGHRKSEFLEKRLKAVRSDLLMAESNLKAFQEKNKLVAIDAQARVAIEGAAKLNGEIIAAQTELKVLKQFGTERQNEAVMLKAKIAELEHQLARIETGNPTEEKDSVYISFKALPALGMELTRLMREAKLQEEVFKLITTQYELAEIEEAKDVNTIQVLDTAIPPDTKSGPNRILIVLLSALGSFLVAIFLAFFCEFLDRLKADDTGRYQQLIRGLKFRKPK